MSKFFKKFSPNQWRRLLKNALVCALVLAAVAVTYGYYLLEKMSSEYNQAQLVSMQDEEGLEESLFEQPTDNKTEKQTADELSEEDKTLAVMADDKQMGSEELSESIADDETENKTAAEPNDDKEQIAETPVTYEAVGAVEGVTEAPCDVKETYVYGYGYDPIYNDVHFHNHALYQAEEKFDIVAVADGVVEKCQASEDGTEITIKHSWGLSVYAKAANVTVKTGERIAKGQKLGETTELSFSLWQAK